MRIHGQDLAAFAGGPANIIGQRLRQATLAVIGYDDGVNPADRPIQEPHGSLGLFGGHRPLAFPVDAHHLLIACDDSGFHGGEIGVVPLHRGRIDPRGPQQAEQALPLRVGPHDSHHRGARGKFPHVTGYVCGAAWVIRFPGYVHHGDRRLRRDARNLAPDEFIEHEIADHENSLGGETGDPFLCGAECGLHAKPRPATDEFNKPRLSPQAARSAGARHGDQGQARPWHKPVQAAPKPDGLVEDLEDRLIDVFRSQYFAVGPPWRRSGFIEAINAFDGEPLRFQQPAGFLRTVAALMSQPSIKRPEQGRDRSERGSPLPHPASTPRAWKRAPGRGLRDPPVR